MDHLMAMVEATGGIKSSTIAFAHLDELCACTVVWTYAGRGEGGFSAFFCRYFDDRSIDSRDI